MEISFPGDYPHTPFFLRMVTPRCVWCAAWGTPTNPAHAAATAVGQLLCAVRAPGSASCQPLPGMSNVRACARQPCRARRRAGVHCASAVISAELHARLRRCRYTGHVTAGGSICIEMLTQSGTPSSWQPGMCVESVMNTVIQNMCAAPALPLAMPGTWQ
jgi:hypothetical protein